MTKYSRQREAIVTFLEARTDHPSAETIYQSLRREHPNLSLGTVYRNLSLLEASGKIMRLTPDGGSDRFDPNPRPHYHFYCRACGCLTDLPMSVLDSLNQLAQAHIPGAVEKHSLTFIGLCPDCMAAEHTGNLRQKEKET